MIDRKFEVRFIVRFTAIVLAGLVLIGLILFLAIPKSTVRDYADAIQSFIKAETAISQTIRIALAIEAIVISAMVVLTAVLASHKIAGPIYRLQKVFYELVNKRKAAPIKFRANDQLMDTARSFNSMLEGLKDNFSAINNAYEEFEKARKELDSTPESIRALKEKVENIEKATEKFIL